MTPENDDLGEPFKPEDFNSLPNDDMSIPWPQHFMAHKANLRLKELMKDAPRLYQNPKMGWNEVSWDEFGLINAITCQIAPWTIRELLPKEAVKEEKE